MARVPGLRDGARAEARLLRATASAFLARAAEALFRFTAQPTAAMILEIEGWRSAFPELATIERELGACRSQEPQADLLTTPFGRLDAGGDRTRRPRPGRGRADD